MFIHTEDVFRSNLVRALFSLAQSARFRSLRRSTAHSAFSSAVFLQTKSSMQCCWLRTLFMCKFFLFHTSVSGFSTKKIFFCLVSWWKMFLVKSGFTFQSRFLCEKASYLGIYCSEYCPICKGLHDPVKYKRISNEDQGCPFTFRWQRSRKLGRTATRPNCTVAFF